MIRNNVEQFKHLLLKASVSDNRYPVKGCHVLLPYGYKLKENIFEMIETSIEANGYQKFQFPRLIPGESMKPVTKYIDDFEDSLFWLRRKDGTPLDVFLSPTGECAVYTMFRKWIKNKSDLPLRAYQRGSIFRYHKSPIAMYNGDERMDLAECHAAFSSEKEAEKEFERTVTIFKEVVTKLGVPSLILRRPRWGNKPVFTDMVSFETYLPSKQRVFNVAVVYNQDQIFSRPFGVGYVDTDGSKQYTYQITSGISERIITAMLDVHRDETGLRLMPDFAPEQVTIVPVYRGTRNDDVNEYARQLAEHMKGQYRVNLDLSRENAHPGKKIAASRTRGVPILIGIGPNNIDDQTCSIYVRTRTPPVDDFHVGDLNTAIPSFFTEVETAIKEDANHYMDSQITSALTIDETMEVVRGNRIAAFDFCGETPCIERLDKELPGELVGTEPYEEPRGACLSCDKDAYFRGFYSKRSDSP
ncbi:MAG: aminoacyl--tRNA ligase-related protein [Candidatus Aenigmatarchaeota archaeon]